MLSTDKECIINIKKWVNKDKKIKLLISKVFFFNVMMENKINIFSTLICSPLSLKNVTAKFPTTPQEFVHTMKTSQCIQS